MIADTQVASSMKTAVCLTVLDALEQSIRTSQILASRRYLLHPRSSAAPKLLRLAVDLLQPRSSLPHGPGRKEVFPRHSYGDGAAFFAQSGEV